MADLKAGVSCGVKRRGETALDELEEKWGQQYPVVLQSWRRKWENLSSLYFRYPANIRKSFTPRMQSNQLHRQFRKLTKTKGFPRARKRSVEAALSGTDERSGKMDNADPELEFDIVAVGDLF